MEDVKEKLVELLDEAEEWADHKCDELDCEKCPADKMKGNCVQQLMVDRLIAHGVTVQEWISVKDGLPEESGEYLVYCGEYDGICVLYYEILKTKSKWRSNWKEVTHWMPLPQPPEGDEVK